MTEITHDMIKTATDAFLLQMRAEWVKMNPNQPCPIKPFDEYKPESRGAMLRAIGRALKAAL